MKEFGLFINGEWRPARRRETMPAINPATEEAWAQVPAAGVEDVQDAVAAAKAAFRSGVWSDRSPAERAEVLNNMANLVFARAEDLVAAEVQDAGATVRKASTADIPATGLTLMNLAELLLTQAQEEQFEEIDPVPSTNLIRKEPLGVVAGIVPWNFPTLMAAWKIGPAIAAGNTIVLKPSPNASVSALMLAEIAQEAGVPPGVVNVITGPAPELGEAMVTHSDVAKVAFTGSTRTGKRIMELASGTLKRLTLELGGKSANIILEDADLDLAARGALFGVFFHAGQICVSGTRVLVPHRLHDELVQRMIDASSELQMGDPADPMTTLGPLINEQQRASVERYVASGLQEGARLVMGGHRPRGFDRGYYFEPTIFTGVHNDMKIAREEIFGPVISVIPYHDEAEAIRIANDSLYGLAGGLWSKNLEHATDIARRLETGTIWINDYHMVNLKLPFGGYKQSGFGRELGHWGLEEYQQLKHIHVGQSTPASEKPYLGWIFNSME